MRTMPAALRRISTRIPILFLVAFSSVAEERPKTAVELLLGGLIEVFSEDFESGECSLWSNTSNPPGAPDDDGDDYGDQNLPTAYCQLPADLAPNFTDCNDGNAAIHPDAFEACNSVDDDCNADTLDGFGESWLGQACDGTDSDLCSTGQLICNAGGQACSDDAASTVDLCDGQDNDCDATSADGSEDPLFGTACDSQVDSDLCATGTMACNGVSLFCTDDATSTVDLCDGQDNDCDEASGDGSEEALFGVACDSPIDTDFCPTGTMACNGVSLYCTDDASSTVELCNGDGVDEDCDGQVDEGCP